MIELENGNVIIDGDSIKKLREDYYNNPNENIIINGGFDIWQRGDSLTESLADDTNLDVTFDTADRFRIADNTITYFGTQSLQGSWNQQRIYENGTIWARYTQLTAMNPSMDYVVRPFTYIVEGNTKSNLNNKTITLSFKMMSSHTGTYNVSFGKGNDKEFYTTEFEYTAADTVQYIVLTVETTGDVYETSRPRALEIYFFYQVPKYTTLESDSNINKWGGTHLTTTKALKFQHIDNFYVQIAEVKLEEGRFPTKFVRPNYVDELLRCQRYFEELATVRGGQYTSDLTGWSFCARKYRTEKAIHPTLNYTIDGGTYYATHSNTRVFEEYFTTPDGGYASLSNVSAEAEI